VPTPADGVCSVASDERLKMGKWNSRAKSDSGLSCAPGEARLVKVRCDFLLRNGPLPEQINGRWKLGW